MIPCFGGYWGQGQDIGGDSGSDTDWGHTLATKQMLSDRPGVLYRLHRGSITRSPTSPDLLLNVLENLILITS